MRRPSRRFRCFLFPMAMPSRCWRHWQVVNPNPDVWDWHEYDLLFDTAQKHGVRILLQLLPEMAPHWMDPEQFRASPATPIGSAPAPSPYSARGRKLAGEYIRRIAER